MSDRQDSTPVQSRAGQTQGHPVNDTIRDVMRPRPRVLAAGAMISEAAELMRREDIGDVIVVEEDRLYGILTDRDIVVRVLAEGQDPSQTRIGDVCSRELATIGPEDSVGQAVQLMRERAIRRLPVTEGDEVVGILTIGDIAVERDSRTALADISAAPPNT
ncbi:MAG: CBS domain-containing protein [Candidatus Rokuibacteriota bacterium]